MNVVLPEPAMPMQTMATGEGEGEGEEEVMTRDAVGVGG
jgi:hypothetical protein